MYKLLIRPILFRFSPERAHNMTLRMLRFLRRIPLLPGLIRLFYKCESPTLKRNVMGLDFPNPVGLAAGIDKNGDYYNELAWFGFSFVEIGSLTLEPQEGNPRPRLFRLPQDKALMKPFLLKEYSEEKHANEADVRVCTVMLNFIHELQKGTLSRRHIADLYSTLRFTDYNEKKVTDVLQLLKERKLAARILQILHESLGLEEGFMPMDAKNDRGTRKIKRLLYKANIQ